MRDYYALIPFLFVGRNVCQLLRHHLRHTAGNTAVYFVKHHCGNFFRQRSYVFHRQHKTGHFATGNYLGKRLQRFAHICRHQKHSPVETVACRSHTVLFKCGRFLKLNFKTGAFHSQIGKFRHYPLGKTLRRFVPFFRLSARHAVHFTANLLFFLGKLTYFFVAVQQLVVLFFRLLQKLQRLRNTSAVLAFYSANFFQTGVYPVRLGRTELGTVQKVFHFRSNVVKFQPARGKSFQQFFGIAFHIGDTAQTAHCRSNLRHCAVFVAQTPLCNAQCRCDFFHVCHAFVRGKQLFLFLLVGIDSLYLVYLILQHVQHAFTLGVAAAKTFELSVEGGKLSVQFRQTHVVAVKIAKTVQNVELVFLVEKRKVLSLSENVHKFGTDFLQNGKRSRFALNTNFVFALHRHFAVEENFRISAVAVLVQLVQNGGIFLHLKQSRYLGAVFTVFDESFVGTVTQHKAQRIHNYGFAAARFSRKCGQPLFKGNFQMRYQRYVVYYQIFYHNFSVTSMRVFCRQCDWRRHVWGKR